ncbi:LysR family transcriptional regulator [Pseudonocardia xishanensis]|uniref:LysR substrate-binding domain-containing protein n=1 Tax=Pseudonocardia xishanensis TaxID=630995 RepID=A0ABP8S1S9_9PSEU
MDLRQLQYFTVIVREGSLSRAAHKLHVGQPALSKQIQALERELGVELLVRMPGGVRPTVPGARLMEMSQTLLTYVEDIRSAVRAAASTLTGTVRLGLSPSLVPALAGYLEGRFAERHPQARIEIVEALPMFLEEWIEEGRLELGVFTHQAGPPNPLLSTVVVGTDAMLLVARRGTVPALPDPATADALHALRLVMTPGFRDFLRASTDLVSDTDDTGSRTDSIHRVRDLVARGEYCSILPFTFVREDLEAGVLVAARLQPAVERELLAATRAGRRPSPAANAVIALARVRLTELAALRAVAGCGPA